MCFVAGMAMLSVNENFSESFDHSLEAEPTLTSWSKSNAQSLSGFGYDLLESRFCSPMLLIDKG